MRETDTFIGFLRFSTHIAARFRRATPQWEEGYGVAGCWNDEFLLDRSSLELRRMNFEAAGVECPETHSALATWPAT